MYLLCVFLLGRDCSTLEEGITEEQRSFVRFFLGAKGLNSKDIHRNSSVYGGKCLSRKAVHK
jgi:hypothetical protein